MPGKKFQGRVLQTSMIKREAEEDSRLLHYINSFEEYWWHGFSPTIGKDVSTSRPNPPTGHRHAHLRPDQFPSVRGRFSQTRTCWDQWHNKLGQVKKVPTSDSNLFYMVDVLRNAYIFHYEDGNAHSFMESADFSLMVERVGNAVKNDLMNSQEHHELFDPKWLRND